MKTFRCTHQASQLTLQGLTQNNTHKRDVKYSKAQVISNAQNRKIKNIQKRMEELNKLIIYELKDVTVQQIQKVNCFEN